ncbi:hypothetical protein KUL150_10330 [Alteromonas sp. KUL150]|uniref:hypothetical protein n=1 Tax=Alteromonas sp. KUL150 TaxID=2480805 RepID=UPI0012E6A9DF|nr:hypothetical protein [Alteromonas sp. KUL150]GFD84974.1 hypothetical protein KUL150_10330 [Alteromonas sp. KUL150]
MDRLFDINLTKANGWTDGQEWAECNPAQELESIYKRIFSDSSEDNPTYRLDPGDNFFIGAHPNTVRDWTPRTLPWNFDVNKGRDGNPLSFYFGLQAGSRDIDTNLENHSPWIQNVSGDLIILSVDYHRFFGVKLKDSDPFIKLASDNRGGEVHGAILSNAGLIDTQGYAMFDWILRKLTFINTIFKVLDIPIGSRNVSTQDFDITGTGDIGMVIRAGHSNMEVIGGTITNDNHQFSETETLYYGLELEQGGKAIVREVHTSGFSGNGFRFDCEVDAKNLSSTRDGAGLEFFELAEARDCMVSWTRQLSGDSFAYYLHKGGVLNNCGCNLEEVGGLGVIVIGPNATVTINGGDYRAHLPLPFLSAQGPCTVILNNVTLNGVLYYETVELLEGESWRGEKATVTMDPIPVYANKTLYLPFMHIPQLNDAIAVQGTERPFQSVIILPSGARVLPTVNGSVRYMPAEAWLHLDPGETAIDYFRYSTETLIYMHQFTIHPSPEVGAKVVQPEGFSGSGWSKSGANYYSNGTSNPLTANYAFEEGEVYQISLKLVEKVSGSVTPKIGSAVGQYSHNIEGTEVWLIRAPANATQIQITASGYKGNVQNIYVRKLLRSETPAVPTLSANVSGSTVDLDWRIIPARRLRDTFTADVHIQNQEMAMNVQDGYRKSSSEGLSFLFENVSVQNRRNGITLKGAESFEVDGMDFKGGYTGQYDTWQVAIVGDLYGPFVKNQQLCNITADLYLDSNYGNYNSQFGNSDIIVINSSNWDEDSFLYSAHIYNLDGKNGSDSITDLKKRTEMTYSRLEGACKITRTHKHGCVTLANNEYIQGYGTREVFSVSDSAAYFEIWNCVVDGVRCVSVPQMNAQKKDASYHFEGRGLLGGHHNSITVLKTYPTLDDLNRAVMTDMEFEVSSDGGSSWSPLAVPNVGLPGVVGCFKRSLSFTSGTHKIRCRCLNGALKGTWSNTISITV